MSAQSSSTKTYLLKNASVTAVLSGAGVAVGLALDALILNFYGAGHETDALFTALTLPTLLIGVFSIQCPKILVPAFADYFSKDDFAAAWKLLNGLLTGVGLILLGIWLLGLPLSKPIVGLQIPGLESETIALAARLGQLLLVLVLLQGIGAMLQSALYAKHSYVVSSCGKVVTNVVTVLLVVFGHKSLGILAVAIGMVSGAALQVCLLLAALYRHGFRYKFSLDRTDAKFWEVVTAFRRPIVGHVFGESGSILQNILGSFLGSGSVTVLKYGSRIVQAIAGILLGSVVQVTLPLMSKHAASNDLTVQRKTLLESIQLLAVIGLPVCFWLGLAARPLVLLLFERGRFSPEDAALTGLVVILMAPDVLLGRLVSLTQTLFYANLDTRTPLVSTLISTCVNTVLATTLSRAFGVTGVAVAVSLASISNTIYMLWKLQREFGPIGWVNIQSFAFRLITACMIGGAGMFIGSRFVVTSAVPYITAKLLALAVPTLFGACAFLIGAYLLRLMKSLLVTDWKMS